MTGVSEDDFAPLAWDAFKESMGDQKRLEGNREFEGDWINGCCNKISKTEEETCNKINPIINLDIKYDLSTDLPEKGIGLIHPDIEVSFPESMELTGLVPTGTTLPKNWKTLTKNAEFVGQKEGARD